MKEVGRYPSGTLFVTVQSPTAMHPTSTGCFHLGIGPPQITYSRCTDSLLYHPPPPPCSWSPGRAHGCWKDQSRQSRNTKSQSSRCNVTQEKQCGRTAAAYRVHLFCTWSYLWWEVRSSGPRCTRRNHKPQEKPDHLQPDVTTTRVLYRGVSTHSLSVTTARVLYRRGASTRCLCRTTAWVLYQGSPSRRSTLPFGSVIRRWSGLYHLQPTSGPQRGVLIYGPRKQDTVPASGTPGAPHPSPASTCPWRDTKYYLFLVLKIQTENDTYALLDRHQRRK